MQIQSMFKVATFREMHSMHIISNCYDCLVIMLHPCVPQHKRGLPGRDWSSGRSPPPTRPPPRSRS